MGQVEDEKEHEKGWVSPAHRLLLGLCSRQQMSLPIAGCAVAATAGALVDRLGGRVTVRAVPVAAPGCAALAKR